MAQQSDIHSQRLLIVDFGSQYTNSLPVGCANAGGLLYEIYPFDIKRSGSQRIRARVSFCLAALKVLRVMKRHELIRVFLR